MVFIKEGVAESITFEPWSEELIKRLSIIEINNTTLYDNQTPANNGLRDEKLGITSRKGVCKTCNKTWKDCPGHWGYLDLGVSLYHPGWADIIYRTLKMYCLSCFTPIDKLNKSKECKFCGTTYPVINKNDTWYISINKKPMMASQTLEILKNIKKNHPDNDITFTILNVLPIPPTPIRPSPTIGGDEIRGEDEITRTLLRIVRINSTIQKHIKNNISPTQIKNIIKKFQEVVSSYIYKTKVANRKTDANKSSSIADRLRTKKGRFRGNCMGKRCNFTARSVITGDPNLGMHEVGVPQYVADTITITENINRFNIEKWRKDLDLNKNDNNRQAKYVITKEGKRIDLKFQSKPYIDEDYKVERKLKDGDIVLFNRQPSLHKMSIMAHEVRIMPYKTFRLNLSCTTPYNADFDGDEMNLHGLQTIEARVEAREIMAVSKNIITPQSHRPVMGIIQDTLVGSYDFSSKDTFLTMKKVSDWCIETKKFTIPTPAIVHPKPLWTGKQMLSMLMPRKLLYKQGNVFNLNDDKTYIVNGIVLKGTFSKKVLGRSQHSIIHVIFNDFGHIEARNFINNLQRGITRWWQGQGFSIGIGDMVTSFDTKKKIEEIYNKTIEECKDMTNENKINFHLNQARNTMGRIAIDTIPKHNRLRKMIVSGSKGSNVNILQIMSSLGQQNCEGQRIKPTIGEKTLPCFRPNEKHPRTKGMIRHSYMDGLTPDEYFFHTIVGREGLIHTAVKTSQTGYVQRRMVKALESLHVEWDNTIRDSEGRILEFVYGEDGYDGVIFEMNTITTHYMTENELKDTYERSGYKADEEWKNIKEAIEILKYSRVEKTIPVAINPAREVFKSLFHVKGVPLDEKRTYEILENYLEWFKNENLIAWCAIVCNMSVKQILKHGAMTDITLQTILEKMKFTLESSKIAPGEMVGTLAAQSLGEPVTQMTLNTFHNAGVATKNVTLGVPRFEELINATKYPKTPSCSIIFKKSDRAHIDKAVSLCIDIISVFIKQVVKDIETREINPNVEYPLYSAFPDANNVCKKNKVWSSRLTICPSLLAKYQIEFELVLDAIKTKYNKGFNVYHKDNKISDSYIDIIPSGKRNNQDFIENMKNRIIQIKIKGVEKISNAIIIISNDVLSIETDGTNLQSLINIQCDEIKTVRSNDPFDVAATLGIEAARDTLLKEIQLVLGFDGSYVNIRHYLILVDWMTFMGHITATTRHGVSKYYTKSPLSRATFEQPVEICLKAAHKRTTDELSGISEQLLLGIPPKCGTSTVCVVPTEEYKEILKKKEEDQEMEDDDDPWIVMDEGHNKHPFGNMNNTAMMPTGGMFVGNDGEWDEPVIQPNAFNSNPMWAQPSMPNWSQPAMNTSMQQPSSMQVAGFGNTQAPMPMFNKPMNFNPPSMIFNPPSMSFNPLKRKAQGPPAPQWAPNPNEYTDFVPKSPDYDPNGPGSPMSPAYSPKSPTYDPNGPGSPVSPAYSPTSPAYSPTSPAYSPTSPTYDPNGPNSPMSPAYSPTSPGYNGKVYNPEDYSNNT